MCQGQDYVRIVNVDAVLRQCNHVAWDPRVVLYFYKDSESAIKLILAYVQFEKSVPKIYEFFGKNSIFRQKNAYISKTTGAIIKNSMPIVFFLCDFTYDTKISSKSEQI